MLSLLLQLPPKAPLLGPLWGGEEVGRLILTGVAGAVGGRPPPAGARPPSAHAPSTPPGGELAEQRG